MGAVVILARGAAGTRPRIGKDLVYFKNDCCGWKWNSLMEGDAEELSLGQMASHVL